MGGKGSHIHGSGGTLKRSEKRFQAVAPGLGIPRVRGAPRSLFSRMESSFLCRMISAFIAARLARNSAALPEARAGILAQT